MEPKDKAPVHSQTNSSVESNVRAKLDKAWDHATLHIQDGKKRQKGEVAACKLVSAVVRFTMQGLLKENDKKAKDKDVEVGCSAIMSDEDEEEQEITQHQKGKKKATSNAKNSISLLIDSYRSQRIDSGCTIMSYGWTDIRQCHLINFLVYCPKGISFIKSVDASDIENNATNLCNLFAEIAEIVGAKNVVQMVTDNAANYKAAGKMLTNRYRHMVWFPCAAHYLNLVLKDISKLDNVKDIITLASRVTIFIYNHKWPLSWLRKRPGRTEIIRPAVTRFGTAFIALKSLVDHKNDLQALVISNEFKMMLKLKNAVDSYWLNPAFQYDRENFCKKSELFIGVLDMVENYFPSDEIFKVTKLLGIYRDSEGEFSRINAVKGRSQRRSENLSGYTLIDEDEHDSEFRLLSDNELDAYNTPMSQ
nr:hypothetical protein [Tanacetum cinerariifolium]